ncbi:GNAT family N-acetyltransferase [Cryptosporangium phraense]|uniref:GNAT family N-acetyltransferase n=1 Tax=Cryptosporangium phraense TaxID=2593070 RepID=A0A545AI55_9ACTN|nr:GNAT family N-acetyltransferase [Cryptosporangium phraense]TQS41004.1 GNAT family N-acetyltransferase [Cryptosporangium phraense]
MLTVDAVDVTDEAAFRQWFSVRVRAHLADAPSLPATSFEEARSDLPRPGDPYDRWHHLIALDGSEPVGSARAELTCDNPDLAYLTVVVRPDARRRGVGSALLGALEDWSAEAGCTALIGDTMRPAGSAVPGDAFAAEHGYRAGAVSVFRLLDVPEALTRLDALDPGVPSGYRVVTWAERCPSELLEFRAALNEEIAADDPATRQAVEAWDGARVRAYEDRMIAAGRSRLCAGVVETASGELVAVTWFVRPPGEREHVKQLGTVVARKHRGHRLGLLVKVANLRQLGSAWPGTRVVSSWNGDLNAAMIAINSALGYRVAGEGTDWEKSFRS